MDDRSAQHLGVDSAKPTMSHLPSLRALDAQDDALLRTELEYISVLRQMGVVRALADELERVDTAGPASGLREQLVEELARLGCRALEAAVALSGLQRGPRKAAPSDRASGVWLTRPCRDDSGRPAERR